MKKRLMILVLGGLIAFSAAGMGFGTNVASAAEASTQGQIMQGNQGMMDSKSMVEMMKSPYGQNQWVQAMHTPEMQQAMINLMKQPEMQAIMKQMMQSDMNFHQMMLDLANSVDMNTDRGDMSGNSAMGSMNMGGMNMSGSN